MEAKVGLNWFNALVVPVGGLEELSVEYLLNVEGPLPPDNKEGPLFSLICLLSQVMVCKLPSSFCCESSS